MENTVPNSTHLSQACPEKDRRHDDLIISCVVRSGRITEPANIISHNTGNESRRGVGHEAHRITDPPVGGVRA